MLGLDGLKLDGNLFTRDDVDAEVDVTEGTRTNLLTDAVLAADTKIHLGYFAGVRKTRCGKWW